MAATIINPADYPTARDYVNAFFAAAAAGGYSTLAAYLPAYWQWLDEFERLVATDDPRTRAYARDRHPEHSFAGRMSGVLGDGQMQIRERLRLWRDTQK